MSSLTCEIGKHICTINSSSLFVFLEGLDLFQIGTKDSESSIMFSITCVYFIVFHLELFKGIKANLVVTSWALHRLKQQKTFLKYISVNFKTWKTLKCPHALHWSKMNMFKNLVYRHWFLLNGLLEDLLTKLLMYSY